MPIQLITGVPGAGKTLFTVSEVLPVYLGQSIEYRGESVPRRLVIGGVPDLLLPHELVDVPTFDPENFKDEFAAVRRDPGDPPVTHQDNPRDPGNPIPVPMRADNWWLWCLPGDVIVIDECQRLFRPLAFGRKIPKAIEMLETHRHYGVDFVLITQHPQLLHKNVRELVGKHQHVRRVYGGGSTIVYEWDHCTHPDRTKNATTRFWKHKKAAFGLYKSAEVHTKQKHSLPFGLVAAFLAVLLLVPFGVFLKGRLIDRHKPEVAASAPQLPTLPASSPAPDEPLTKLYASSYTPGVPDFRRPEWPDEIAGCYIQGDECVCIYQTPGPRFVRGREAFCRAVVAGDYVVPASHKPFEPDPDAAPSPEPSPSAPTGDIALGASVDGGAR